MIQQVKNAIKNTPPTGKTVGAVAGGSSLAVLLVMVFEMFDLPNLTPERAAMFTSALGTGCGYVKHWFHKNDRGASCPTE